MGDGRAQGHAVVSTGAVVGERASSEGYHGRGGNGDGNGDVGSPGCVGGGKAEPDRRTGPKNQQSEDYSSGLNKTGKCERRGCFSPFHIGLGRL